MARHHWFIFICFAAHCFWSNAENLRPASRFKRDEQVQKSEVVPSVHQIPGGMFPGKTIRVNGSTSLEAHWFVIDLQCGPNGYPSDDIALHMSIRFPEGTLVRNHWSAGAWGSEETTGRLPLIRGKPFTAVIHCDENSFRIVLDGVQFCTFDHRLPYQRVTHIRISGDVMVTFIGFQGGQSAPPIHDLVAPYVHQISGGMFPGKIIKVNGTAALDAHRFIIDLESGGDIALHMSIRFPEGTLIRNHWSAGAWGPQETTGRLPLIRGKPFTAVIHCDENSFRIVLDGVQFCTFAHRLPYQRINRIRISGDVMVSLIGFEVDQNAPPVQDLVVPYVRRIPVSFTPESEIKIKGSVSTEANRFLINLQCGPNGDPSEDIALHMSIRFPEGTLIRNHFSGGKWGSEETAGLLPIIRGRPFTVVVHCDENSFKIIVNSVEFCTFVHRLPYQRITHVKIVGDVELKDVSFEGVLVYGRREILENMKIF